MGAKKNTVKIDYVAEKSGMGLSWIYKRTAPKSKLTPRIPRLSNISVLRFDQEVIDNLFSTPVAHVRPSSLKIEQMEKPHSTTASSLSQRKRRFEKL